MQTLPFAQFNTYDRPILESYPVSLRDAMGATAENLFDVEHSIFSTANQLVTAEESFQRASLFRMSMTRGITTPQVYQWDQAMLERAREEDAETELVDPEEAMQEARERGVPELVFKTAVRRDHLDIIIEANRREAKRQSTFARLRASQYPIVLATDLLLRLSDPEEVLVGMIPFTGQLRALKPLRNMGKFRKAAIVGAADGLVGASAVEPLVFNRASQLQVDYTMADALVNIAFGTALSSGLHTLGAALRFRPKAPPDTDNTDALIKFIRGETDLRTADETGLVKPRRVVAEIFDDTQTDRLPLPDDHPMKQFDRRIGAVLDAMPEGIRRGLLAKAISDVVNGRRVNVNALIKEVRKQAGALEPEAVAELNDFIAVTKEFFDDFQPEATGTNRVADDFEFDGKEDVDAPETNAPEDVVDEASTGNFEEDLFRQEVDTLVRQNPLFEGSDVDRVVDDILAPDTKGKALNDFEGNQEALDAFLECVVSTIDGAV